MSDHLPWIPYSWNDDSPIFKHPFPILDPVVNQGDLLCCWIISLVRQQTALFKILRILESGESFSIAHAYEGITTSPHRSWIHPNGGLLGGVLGLTGIGSYFLTEGLSVVGDVPPAFLDVNGTLAHDFFPDTIRRDVLRDYQVMLPEHFGGRRDVFNNFLCECLVRSPISIIFPIVVNNRTEHNYGHGIYNPHSSVQILNSHVALAIGYARDENGNFYIDFQDSSGTSFGDGGIVRIGVDTILAFVRMEAPTYF